MLLRGLPEVVSGRDCSSFGEDTHDIASQNLAEHAAANSRPEEGVCQPRQPARVGQLAGRNDEAVPVAPERGNVFADGVEYVPKVPDHLLDPIAAEIARVEDDADDPPEVRDCPQLLVVDVARVCVSAEQPGVAHDGRLARDPARVQKPGTVDVRQVDEHTCRLATANEIEAPPRQAGVIATSTSVRRIARMVRGEMQQAEVSHAAAREVVDLVEVALERVGTLDSQKPGDHAVSTTELDFVRRPGDPQFRWMKGGRLDQKINLVSDGSRQPRRVRNEREGYEPEKLSSHARVSKPWQVDVTAESRSPEGRFVPDEKVVAKPARPHERVRVQIDGRVLGVKRSRVFRSFHRALYRALDRMRVF